MIDFDMIRIIATLSFFLIAAFSIFIMIKYGNHNPLMYLVIPIVLVLSTYTYKISESLMGYPVSISGQGMEQMYVHHYTGPNREWIYIWAIDLKLSKIPRAYKIPFSEENEKKMMEAKKKQDQGYPQIMKSGEIDNPNKGNRTELSIQFYKFSGAAASDK